MKDKIFTITLKFIALNDQRYFETYKERLIYYIKKMACTFGWEIIEIKDVIND